MSGFSKAKLYDLSLELFKTYFNETESFREDNLGADLAYLMGAILENEPDVNVFQYEDESDHSRFLTILREGYPESHWIWNFVRKNPTRSELPREMIAGLSVDNALARCSEFPAKSLGDFLGGLLDEKLEVLAQLPGTPGQVMASQFAYYARTSVPLAESYHRDTSNSQLLIQTLHRLSEVKEKT